MSKSEWKVCSKCGFVHQNPRPSIQQLNEFYLKSEYHQIQIPDWYLESNGKYYLDFARWYYIEKIAYAIKKSGLPKILRLIILYTLIMQSKFKLEKLCIKS